MIIYRFVFSLGVLAFFNRNSVETYEEDGDVRIFGGTSVEISKAPFQVSVQYINSHYCGGAIIHPYFVLTAAHCIRDKDTIDVRILVGTNDLKNGSIYYRSKKFFIHSRHGRPRFRNDIGLIRLKDPIQFTDKVKPTNYSWRQLHDKTTLTLTGWGKVSSGFFPNKLHTIDLTYIGFKKCRELHSKYNEIDFSQACTFTRTGEGSCLGDSGSPLTYQGEIVAIVNYGIPCARGFPDVHARISYFHDWIRTTINNNIDSDD